MSKGSILFVDDNTMLLDMLREGLSREVYDFETVDNAGGALRLVEMSPFELLITDIDMPDMDGLELARKAKRLRSGIKVIIMTGLTFKFSWDKAMAASPSDFIKKPFTPKELAARISQVKMCEEFKRKVKELEEFYDIAVGRELRIKELKEEVEELRKELEKYRKG